MTTGKILLAVLAGAAVGATLGILFAPDKGSATRKKISKRGRHLADEVGDKFNEFIESFRRKFEAVRDEAARAAENGTSKAEPTEAEENAATY